MSNKTSKKFPVWATVFTLICVIILIGLGTWQLQRLQWKNEIIAALDKANQSDYEELDSFDFKKADIHHELFLKGFIRGHFLHDKEIAVGPRTHEGLNGFHIVTPFRLEDGSTILVNRGWVPPEMKNALKRADGQEQGLIIVPGIAHRPDHVNMFVPPNDPENNEWFSINLDDIAAYTGQKNLLPFVFYASRPAYPRYTYPLGHDKSWRPTNNHLGYAVFWYLTALTLVVLYYFRFIHVPKDDKTAAGKKKNQKKT